MEFVDLVEQWSSRRRRFNDAFETILESGGMAKKKLADDVGVEFDEGDLGEKLTEYKKIVVGNVQRALFFFTVQFTHSVFVF